MFDKKLFKAQLVLSGKTVADVAKSLNISESTLYRKINGDSDFFRHEINMLCDELGITDPKAIFFADKVT